MAPRPSTNSLKEALVNEIGKPPEEIADAFPPGPPIEDPLSIGKQPVVPSNVDALLITEMQRHFGTTPRPKNGRGQEVWKKTDNELHKTDKEKWAAEERLRAEKDPSKIKMLKAEVAALREKSEKLFSEKVKGTEWEGTLPWERKKWVAKKGKKTKKPTEESLAIKAERVAKKHTGPTRKRATGTGAITSGKNGGEDRGDWNPDLRPVPRDGTGDDKPSDALWGGKWSTKPTNNLPVIEREETPSRVEVALARIGERDPEAAERLRKTLEIGGVNVEMYKKAEAILARNAEVHKEADENLEKKGFGNIVRNVGAWYKSVPTAAKLTVSLALSVSALSFSGGAMAIPFVSAMVGHRILTSAAAFVGVEAALSERNKKKEGFFNKNSAGWAAAVAGMVAIGIPGIRLIAGLETMPDAPALREIGNNALEFIGVKPVTALAETAPANTSVVSSPVDVLKKEIDALYGSRYTVQNGDNFWNILKEKSGGFGLDEGRKIYFLDTIKDRLETLPPEEIRKMGISSGTVHLIKPGEVIDFTRVFENQGAVAQTIEGARAISDNTTASILEQSGKQSVINTPTIPASEPSESAPSTTSGTQAEVAASSASETVGTESVATETESPQSLENALQTDIRAGANKMLETELDERFGSKGFFGFGAHTGIESSVWNGLKNMSALALSGAETSAQTADMEKMADLIKEISRGGDLNPSEGETAEQFLRRGMEQMIRKRVSLS